MIGVVRHTQRNVKRWQEGDMRKRWRAAGMLQAEQQFRRIIGYTDLSKLVIAIEPRHLASKPSTTRSAQRLRVRRRARYRLTITIPGDRCRSSTTNRATSTSSSPSEISMPDGSPGTPRYSASKSRSSTIQPRQVLLQLRANVTAEVGDPVTPDRAEHRPGAACARIRA